MTIASCFRWDEIGNYDIPACINYVLKVTRKERLVYIGHSMGNSIASPIELDSC